jgi:hypothetical protein
VLNRIHRVFSLARGRHSSKGRHRRSATPPLSTTVPASAVPVDASSASLRRPLDAAAHRYRLRGEDNALVRPYLLAWERRTRRHSVVVMAPHLSADARSALLGVS